MTPVITGNGRGVATRLVEGVVMMTDRTQVRRRFYARQTGHTTELLSRGLFGSFELPMDVIRGRGGEWKRWTIRVGTSERGADVLLPEFAKVSELCLPRGHPSGGDPTRRGSELARYIDLSEIHENVLVDDALSIVVGEEWSTVRGDAGNDIRVVEAHETKGRRETLMIVRFAGVWMGRRVV